MLHIVKFKRADTEVLPRLNKVKLRLLIDDITADDMIGKIRPKLSLIG